MEPKCLVVALRTGRVVERVITTQYFQKIPALHDPVGLGGPGRRLTN